MALFGASALAPSPAAMRVCLRRVCSAGGAPFCKRSVRGHERYAALLSGDGYSSDRRRTHSVARVDGGRKRSRGSPWMGLDQRSMRLAHAEHRLNAPVGVDRMFECRIHMLRSSFRLNADHADLIEKLSPAVAPCLQSVLLVGSDGGCALLASVPQGRRRLRSSPSCRCKPR
jgi:hypothetical protein